jgi:hypothetical protein
LSALLPPLQTDNHVALIARMAHIVPAHEVCWKAIIDLAYVIDFGLKAAMTRTGSKGHQYFESTPKGMGEQLDMISDVIVLDKNLQFWTKLSNPPDYITGYDTRYYNKSFGIHPIVR